ncbi:MAG: hypothetical protein IPH20_20780 [Bacteroidales bacterium]|nr:hypothetical protein [Bacteroidales bacterium]
MKEIRIKILGMLLLVLAPSVSVQADCVCCFSVVQVNIQYKKGLTEEGFIALKGSFPDSFNNNRESFTGRDLLPLLLDGSDYDSVEFSSGMYRHKQGLPALFADEEVKMINLHDCSGIILVNHFNYVVNGSGSLFTLPKSDVEIIMNSRVVDTAWVFEDVSDQLFINLNAAITKTTLNSIADYYRRNLYSHYIYSLREYAYPYLENGTKPFSRKDLEEALRRTCVGIDTAYNFWSKPTGIEAIDIYHQHKLESFNLMKTVYTAFRLMAITNDVKYFSEIPDLPMDEEVKLKIRKIQEQKFNGDMVERIIALDKAMHCAPDPYDCRFFFDVLRAEKIYSITLGWD